LDLFGPNGQLKVQKYLTLFPTERVSGAGESEAEELKILLCWLQLLRPW